MMAIPDLNVVVSHRLLVLIHLLPLVDQHLVHGLLSRILSWLTWVSGCILFILVKMASLRSITEVIWLTGNSNSSPIMVLTVTVMNIVMAAQIQYKVWKNRCISIFVKMDFLLFRQIFVAWNLQDKSLKASPSIWILAFVILRQSVFPRLCERSAKFALIVFELWEISSSPITINSNSCHPTFWFFLWSFLRLFDRFFSPENGDFVFVFRS